VAKKGRPTIEIDWVKFDELCELQCTLKEFANHFNCSEDTIENKVKQTHGMLFSEYFNLKRCRGFISLRRKQYEAAMSGDRAMLIWLGKQWLGQSEKLESENHNTEIKLAYNVDSESK